MWAKSLRALASTLTSPSGSNCCLDQALSQRRLPTSSNTFNYMGSKIATQTSYLADNALTFAGALALGPRVVTGEYKINFLRPAVNGTLMARAQVVHAGLTQATCQCSVFVMGDGKEKLVAVAQGTVNRLGEGADGTSSAGGK